MKKFKYVLLVTAAVCSAAIFPGCDDDDEASDPKGATFSKTVTSYLEEDGNETVQIAIDGFSGNESDIELSFAGTATEGQDYEVVSFSDGVLTLDLLDDDAAELPETIRIQIVDSKSGVGRVAFHTVSIASDDPGFLDIDLDWAGAPDMDLYLLYRAEEGQAWTLLGFSDPGHVSVDWTDDDGQYGLSYNYYSGNVDPLAFTATFTPTGVNLEGSPDPLVFNGSYTAANKAQPATEDDLIIEQTFIKNGTEFTDFTEITIPTAGSRVGVSNVIIRSGMMPTKNK